MGPRRGETAEHRATFMATAWKSSQSPAGRGQCPLLALYGEKARRDPECGGSGLRLNSGAVLQSLAARRTDAWPIREMDVTVTSVVSSDVAVRQCDSAPLVLRDGNRTVVWLAGECDITTLLVTADTMMKAISLDDGDLIVDLSEVTFLSAATIGALIGVRNLLRGESRSMTLRSPSRFATRILDLCGLDDLVDPHVARAKSSVSPLTRPDPPMPADGGRSPVRRPPLFGPR
jgi:anti-anti-sigma factor